MHTKTLLQLRMDEHITSRVHKQHKAPAMLIGVRGRWAKTMHKHVYNDMRIIKLGI